MAEAVVLAAGKGTRMRSPLPKVLHEVAGKPMLARVLEALKGAGIRDIVVVVGHGADQVRRAFKGRGLRFVTQKPQLGTGHAVLQAEPALRRTKGPLLIIPGDAPLASPDTLRRLIADRGDGRPCAVLTARLENPLHYGRILRDAAGQVSGIVEAALADPRQKEVREINSGIYAFDPAALWPALKRIKPSPPKGEVYLTDVVAGLAREGRAMEGLLAEAPEEALGINTVEDLARAEAFLRRRFLSSLMASGVKVFDPSTTFIETEIPIGAGTQIHPFTVIRRDVRIGRNCHVGPFAHLREGTVLADGAEIGDFVETKKASIGSGSKAKHLAYLGDVTIGRNANIGAGTIVANYDGKAKHHTLVKDGAFVGSGTVLVAPVTVGRGAVTGAGAVVTRGRHVPDRGVVVGVPAKPLKRGKRGLRARP